MATLLLTGAEWGSLAAEGPSASSGSVTATTAAARSGTYGFEQSAATGFATFTAGAPAAGAGIYTRCYLRLGGNPSGDRAVVELATSSASLLRVFVKSDRTLYLQNVPGAAQIGSVSAALTVGQWYRIEVYCKIGTGAVDEATLRLDGTVVASSTTLALAEANVASRYRIGDGTNAPGTTISWDDIAVHDDTGASNNTWPGDGKIVLARPSSDDTVNNFFEGSGSTQTNLWAAVDNLPPAGAVSASETATTNIESNSSSGTAQYVANLPSYTALGVGASDTVLAVQGHVWHGEDIATGTKTGAVQQYQNPTAGAATTFNYGADAGAHGAFPTLWTLTKNAVVEMPSVTLGSGMRLSVTKTDTTTRTACICAMGTYVHYRPAAGGLAKSGTFVGTGGGIATITDVAAFPVVKTGTFVATGGGVATTTASAAHTKLLTATGGGVLVSTRQGSHTKTAVATGGGLGTFVTLPAKGRPFLATGGGIAAIVKSKGGLFALTATGGGVLTTVRTSARSRAITATGGGPATVTRAKGALLLLTGTGGGVLTTVRTSARARAITATGGGIYTQLNLKAVTRLLTGTGGGVLTSILSKGSGRTITGTGGGVAVVTGLKQTGSESHSGSFVATGGGVLVSTRQKGALLPLTATGGGRLVPITIGAHGGPATATGGGVLLVDGRAARAKAITATGGGVAVLVPRKGALRVLAGTGGGALTWLYSTLHRLTLTATGGGVATFSTGQTVNKTATFTATGGGRLVLTASPVHSKAFGATGGGVASLTASRGFGHALVATGGGVLSMAAGSGRVALLRATGGGLLTPAWTGSHQRVWAGTGGGRATFIGLRVQLDAGFMLEQYVGEQPDDPAFQLETPGGSDVGQPTYILET
jgi:hypothetical protein